MRLLALDAATEACSVALLVNGDVLLRSMESGQGHAQSLLAMVEQVLAEGGVSLSMLDGMAASIGPGAFSGVRISVAVAQGLAFGADLKVVPVTTLEALALQVLPAGEARAVACLDARMSEVYWGCFAAQGARGVIPVLGPGVAAPEALIATVAGSDPGAGGRLIGVGRGFFAYPALAGLPGLQINAEQHRALPSAREIARLGALRLVSGVDAADLQPLYLRDKVALTEAERAAGK